MIDKTRHNEALPRTRWPMASIAAASLGAVALCQSDAAAAFPGPPPWWASRRGIFPRAPPRRVPQRRACRAPQRPSGLKSRSLGVKGKPRENRDGRRSVS